MDSQLEPDSKKLKYSEEETKNDNTTMEAQADSAQTPVFIKQYSVIKCVLTKLGIADLLRAGQVCKSWSEIARLVRKKRRNAPFTYVHHAFIPNTMLAIEYFNHNNVSNEAKSVIKGENHNLSRDRFDHEVIPKFLQHMTKFVQEQYWESSLLLFMMTDAMHSLLMMETRQHRGKKSRSDILFGHITNSIPCLASIGYGVVGTLTDGSGSRSFELENPHFPLLCMLSIPRVPGMTIKTFTLTRNSNKDYKNLVNASNCKEVLNISPEDNVKGIVIFKGSTFRVVLDAVYLYLCENPNVAVGGGYVKRTFSSGCDEADQGEIGTTGLIICGDDNVKVAAVALYDDKSLVENEHNLVKLKNSQIEEEGSFCIMFACNGRGYRMHKAEHVEANLFRKHFPKTQLVGVFTGGEYIHEYIPGEKAAPPPSNIEHQFTTVFVFVSCYSPTQ